MDWKQYLEEGVKRFKPENLKEIVEKSDEIRKVLLKSKILKDTLDNAETMVMLLKDYWNREYTSIPYYSIAAIGVALFYLINPFDLIPDFIPVFGYLDDVALFGACLLLVTKDLEKYREWKGLGKTGGETSPA